MAESPLVAWLAEQVGTSPAIHRWQTGDATEDWLAALAVDTAERDVALLLEVAADEVPTEILGALCRRCPERVVVACAAASEAMANRFRSLGFRRLALPAALSGGVPGECWEYRLSDYKQPPAWLNARYWANPERFGRDVIA
ncbi:MAG: hypothetical protein CSA54_06330, partial [Gammaproteobacteria bacterium]